MFFCKELNTELIRQKIYNDKSKGFFEAYKNLN